MESSSENKQQEIGALWLRKSLKGNYYLTGAITIDGKAIEVICHQVKEKKNVRQPDYRVYVGKPRNEEQQF